MDIPRPIRDISCQQMLIIEKVVMQGTLRLRKAMHELLDKISTKASLTGIKWPRVYVVLHNNCLYIFKSETSKVASKAFSLLGFSASVADGDEVAGCKDPWPFKLMYDLSDDPKIYYFSAPSKAEMLKWIDEINRQPVVIASSGGCKGQRLKLEDIASRPRLPTPRESEDLSYDTGHTIGFGIDSDDSDYEPAPLSPPLKTSNQTDDRKLRPAISPPVASKPPAVKPKTPTPGPTTDNKRVRPLVQPKPSLPPPCGKKNESHLPMNKEPEGDGGECCYNEVLYVVGEDYPDFDPEDFKKPMTKPKDILFEKAYWVKANEEAERVMKGLDIRGIYMVRDSHTASSHSYTLLVGMGDQVVKKLKILKNENGKFSLHENGPWFTTVSNLLEHYSSDIVPGLDVRLVKPWSECQNSRR